MTSFESLIADFSGKTGLPLTTGRDGSVSLETDGIYITVQSRPDRNDILLFCFPAGDQKPEPATMEKALELAAHGLGTGGFHLGISAGAFVLSGSMPLDGASAENLGEKLISLAEAAGKVASAFAHAIADSVEAETENRKIRDSGCNLSILQV